MRFMMVEDDRTIAFAVKSFFEIKEVRVDIFYNLEDAEDADIKNYDILILDVNLPDGSGFDFLKYIRGFSDIPVIMLTVKDEEKNVLLGFDSGADEYITKPFSLNILNARIKNVLGRKNKNNILEFHSLKLDKNSKTASMDGENLNLGRQEFDLLFLLVENAGKNMLRENIIDLIWGYDVCEVNDNTLTVTVKRLRKKLGRYGKNIETVRGIGYVWRSEEI